MATKEEAKAKLRKAGYSVVDDNSVLTVIIPAKASIKNTVKQVKDLLTGMDYNASFGVRQHDYSSDDAELSDDSYTEGEENAEVTEAEEEIDLSYSETNETSDAEEEAKVSQASELAQKKRESKKAAATVKSAESKNAESESKKADDKAGSEENDDDFLDDEDENFDEIDNVKLDEYDMDMLLNEESIQFSLEDFGLT